MLNKFDLYQKEVIQLTKRLNQVRREIRNQPYVEVPPFQKGWESSIVLRDDIANRNDADFISHLIDIGYRKTKKINKVEHVRLIRRGIYSYRYKINDQHYEINFIPDKIKLSVKKYESLSDREKSWFMSDSWSWMKPEGYLLYIPDYWIKLKVRACMYNRIMDKNGELESEEHFILSKLTKPPYSKFFYKNSHRYYGDRIKNEIELSKIKLKEGIEEYVISSTKRKE